MKNSFVFRNLSRLFHSAPEVEIEDGHKIVIFSDLHMGNGRSRDDFRDNAEMFSYVLKHFYLPKNYRLILNGDIEELQKFPLRAITENHNSLYELFEEFSNKGYLCKTLGNHDFRLIHKKRYRFHSLLLPALKLRYGQETLFIFHGHQASFFQEKYSTVIGFFLRLIAKPLGIKNYATAYSSRKQFNIEKKVFDFANKNKIITAIGHTHRPLFESLSKVESLKFKIEDLIRQYTAVENEEKEKIEAAIVSYKNELLDYYRQHDSLAIKTGLYDAGLAIPNLFNSGCGIGKRGITALEISDRKIFLVYWSHQDKTKEYLKHYDRKPERLGHSDYFRLVLNDEKLDYVFSKMKLLSH